MTQAVVAALGAILGLVLATGSSAPKPSEEAARRVDHLVFGTPDLALGIERIESLLGIAATAGGQHPGRGTRNALVALGPSAYLEIIGPDPDQPAPAVPRTFGIDRLTSPRLVAWAAKETDLEKRAADAARKGVTLGSVGSGGRKTPEGVLLSWRYTSPTTVLGDGLVPFFIDWGQSPHPARTAAPGATLVGLRAEHPDPRSIDETFKKLGLELPVATGPAPALIATIDCPKGRVELR
jgi:glyoxalase-like protein